MILGWSAAFLEEAEGSGLVLPVEGKVSGGEPAVCHTHKGLHCSAELLSDGLHRGAGWLHSCSAPSQIWAGMELIVFTVARMRLCFGTVLETGMFSLLLSSTFTEPRPFLPLVPPVSRLGVHKELEGTQLTPTYPRDIPDHGTSCSAWNTGRRNWGIWGDGVCVTVTRGGAQLPRGG